MSRRMLRYIDWGLVGAAPRLVIGRTARGAQRWIPLGPLSFQPSEVAKLVLIITFAKHLDGHREITSLRPLVPILLHAALPIALIVQQPDMGTSMVLLAILATMLFAAGTPPPAGAGGGAAAGRPPPGPREGRAD